MSLYHAFRPLLFRMDAETVHERILAAIERGWIKGPGPVSAPVTRFGVNFPNPVGLAAGFDKNARGLHAWASFGFGFAEIGTVTRHAQPGNERPRMFRLPGDQALINRLGFNNEGADAVAPRLENRPKNLVLGVNIGKSKVTPLEQAADDYAYSFQRLKDAADYVTVNVSSPNTPGLRTLQDRGPLSQILWRLREMDGTKPLFIKIAPDLNDEQIADVAALVNDLDITGVVATNTTISRTGLKQDPGQEGGLSGAPLAGRSREVLALIRQQLDAGRIVINVGGIHNEEEARARFVQGADLIQVYTGWVYGGPDFPARIARAIASPVLPR